MKVIKIFILVSIIGIFSCGKTINNANGNTTNNNNDFLILEAENYNDKIGQIRVEEKPNASNNKCVHIGPDSDVENEGIGDELIFNFSLEHDFSMGVFEIYCSDDVGGNIIHVYLDEKNEGSFRTATTGGWNNFELDCQKINLGRLNKASHTIKLEMTKGGSWGVLIDYFKITNVEPIDKVTGAYNYINSLINKNTGLVRSADYDKDFTTVYKNALAAMVFIHENDLNLAEGIFDFFKSKYNKNSFKGFNQFWDPETGNEKETNYWEGDNAFLLLALNYYNEVTGSFGNYKDMVEGLVQWLSERADDDIIAEGLANMYAALKPFKKTVPGIDTVLLRLESGFQDKKDYQAVLDHIERGALCFSDITGFDYIDGFKKAEIWEYNCTEVNGLAAFISENFINVEITAQILLAWKIWKSDLSIDLSYLEIEIDKLWLLGTSSPETVSYGLPYFLSYDPNPQTGHGWPSCYDEPIIDPTCYMLFYYWNFNPMASGRRISTKILVSPTSYNFGEVYIDHSATHTFAISNTGDADLDIFNILLSDTKNFYIQSDECSNQSIRPYESCIVKIYFSPKSGGEKTSELT